MEPSTLQKYRVHLRAVACVNVLTQYQSPEAGPVMGFGISTIADDEAKPPFWASAQVRKRRYPEHTEGVRLGANENPLST